MNKTASGRERRVKKTSKSALEDGEVISLCYKGK